VSFTWSLFNQLFLDCTFFFKIKFYFFDLKKINYFLIIQEKLDKKVHLDDTICKDNYNYCHP
jgi:hypothetical protein